MGGALIAQRDLTASVAVALGLAFQQELHPARQHGDFALLTGDNLGKVVNHAAEVGKGFFGCRHAGVSTKLTFCGQRHVWVT